MNLKCQFIRILLKERNIQQVCHQGSVVFLLKNKKHNHSCIWKDRTFFIVIAVGIIISSNNNSNYYYYFFLQRELKFWCFSLLWRDGHDWKLSLDLYDFAHLCYYIELLSCSILPDAAGFQGEAGGRVWVVTCSKASADFSWCCQIRLPLQLWGLNCIPDRLGSSFNASP